MLYRDLTIFGDMLHQPVTDVIGQFFVCIRFDASCLISFNTSSAVFLDWRNIILLVVTLTYRLVSTAQD
jgi:hypothetical protein